MRNIIVLSVLLFLASSLEADNKFNDGKGCQGIKCDKNEQMCVMRKEGDKQPAYPLCVNRRPSGPMCSGIHCPAGSQCTTGYGKFSPCLLSGPAEHFKGVIVESTTSKPTTPKSVSPEKPPKKSLLGVFKKSTTPKPAAPEKPPKKSLLDVFKKSTTPKPAAPKKPAQKSLQGAVKKSTTPKPVAPKNKP